LSFSDINNTNYKMKTLIFAVGNLENFLKFLEALESDLEAHNLQNWPKDHV